LDYIGGDILNKFSVRYDIERTIKELGLDRSAFFEVSKFRWEEILHDIIEQFVQKTHYSQGLHWAWNRLKEPQVIVRFYNDDAYRYISNLVNDEYVWFIVEDSNDKFWVYEGMPDVITKVIGETSCVNEYYIVSKKYEWLLCDDHHRILHGVGDKIIDEINRFKAQSPELIFQ
jgi:hypothetical protein